MKNLLMLTSVLIILINPTFSLAMHTSEQSFVDNNLKLAALKFNMSNEPVVLPPLSEIFKDFPLWQTGQLPDHFKNIAKPAYKVREITDWSDEKINDYINQLTFKLDRDRMIFVFGVTPTLMRTSMVKLAKMLLSKQVNVVVSDINPDFDATCKTLTDLGFGPRILGNAQIPKTSSKKVIAKRDCSYYRAGFAASIKDDEDGDDKYRQTAFAFKLTHPEVTLSFLKHIVYIDGSSDNIEIFHRDIKRLLSDEEHLAKDLEITTFKLMQ